MFHRRLTLALACLSLCGFAAARAAQGGDAVRAGGAPGEWRVYAADNHGSRYSPLDQINRDNFSKLKVAWKWWSIDNEVAKRRSQQPGPNEATPLLIRGTLYTATNMNQVAAIDPMSGKTLWTYDPETNGNVHRGLAYWEKRRNGRLEQRLYLATRDSHLVALDPATGRPVPGFGKDGKVDLAVGLVKPEDRGLLGQTSPPVVCKDVVVVGGAVDDWQERKDMPRGDVRGYDARTGKLLWTFHTIPQAGEFGNETWENESWKYTGNTNVWTFMTCDPELGYVYLPISTPTSDWYGGHRPGANLFAESLVCLDARTGKRVWHYQMVHHGLWDYDLPCAPNLLDVRVNGKRVKAIAQVTKQAFCFVFDRVTGKPLWPIEERAVPPTRMPGDKAWPTQPFPTRPAAFDRQGVTEDDLIDWTPELRRQAKEMLKDWVHGPLYTPPTDRKTLMMPGWVGGASWAGAATDPETGTLYVSSVTTPMWLRLQKPTSAGASVNFKNAEHGWVVEGPQGLPLFKGPYGRITAIDLNTGDHRWMKPLGEGPRDHPAIRHLNLPPLGRNRRGYLVVTKTLLLAIQEGSWFNSGPHDEAPKLRAFDKRTGELLGEIDVPGHATGAPITYMAYGKQYFAYPTGGASEPAQLIALALP